MSNNLSDQIAEWIETSVKEAGCKGTVLGLSGGLDSAVALALCSKTNMKSMAVIMPCDSNPQDKTDAMELAQKLSVETLIINLAVAKDILIGNLPKSIMPMANLKARLRMSMLYYIANCYNFLVVGTGNKSEIAIGYFTKYGDGAADILPLAHLYKSEVRILAKELDIPEKIISKPPSAGLWEGQTDELEIGMSYEMLDKTLLAIEHQTYLRANKTALIFVKNKINRTEHKRHMPPTFLREDQK